jgi:hypothetical protein
VMNVWRRLGVSSWRRTFRNEPTKALAVPGHQSVECVDDRRQSKCPQNAAERSGEPDLSEEHDTPTSVPGDWRASAGDEPPTLAALLLWHRGEQGPRRLVGKRKQCEFLASVKRGDDPRRPTAEPSAARIEQNRTREEIASYYAGVHVLGPLRSSCRP